MIEVKALTKFYGSVRGIENLTFSIPRGEIAGFLGPNGSGKTTTLRILTCFFPPTTGSAKVAGFDVQTESSQVKKRTGYLPENNPLYLNMSVSEYLHFVAEVKGISRGEKKRGVGKVLERCGIEHVLRRNIGNLSKGYRQRVGLAQALLGDPEILILDEPTLGLDPEQIVEFRKLIKSLEGSCTVLLSTHMIPEVSLTCGYVVIINQGRIIAADRHESLASQIHHSVQLTLQIEGPRDEIIANLRVMPEVFKANEIERHSIDLSTYMVELEEDKDMNGILHSILARRSWTLRELRQEPASLEDIFLKLVQKERGPPEN